MNNKKIKRRKLKTGIFGLPEWADTNGLGFAILAAFMGFFIVPPIGKIQWSIKAFEFFGICLASIAVVSYLVLSIKKKHENYEKELLRDLSNASNLNEEIFKHSVLDKASKITRNSAKRLNYSFKYQRISSCKHIIDFQHHSVIDFIEFRWRRTRILFCVGLVKLQYLEIVSNCISKLKLKLVLTEDNLIEPALSFMPTDSGVIELQKNLSILLSVLNFEAT